MSDLTEFYLARLKEVEQVARAATLGPWRWEVANERTSEEQPELVSETAPESVNTVLTATGEWSPGYVCVDREDRDHIALHDPASVLRDVESKRRMVELHQPDISPIDAWHGNDARCKECGSVWNFNVRAQRLDPALGGCPTLLLLVLPFADHPEYNESWRPLGQRGVS